jgi:hypothetical protein
MNSTEDNNKRDANHKKSELGLKATAELMVKTFKKRLIEYPLQKDTWDQQINHWEETIKFIQDKYPNED